MLIIFGGLSGAGKTTIARELARQIGAMHLRIDSIEQAIRNCVGSLPPLDEAGYRVAYAIAEDNLRIGRTVVADSVNPLSITRDAWLEVGQSAQVDTIEVEVICSDPIEHRSRVETRSTDISGLVLPTWEEVVSREYDAWSRDLFSLTHLTGASSRTSTFFESRFSHAEITESSEAAVQLRIIQHSC